MVVSRDLIHAIRQRQPLVILLEDLHLADAPSLEYLVISCCSMANQEWSLQGGFVLGTSRPEWAPRVLVQAGSWTRYREIDSATLASSWLLALELLSRGAQRMVVT
jgi:hypothetical protein